MASSVLIITAIFGLLALPCLSYNILYDSTTLFENQNITNGEYKLTMQPDCDLALYEGENLTWESNTTGAGVGCRASLLTDGILVIDDEENRRLWQSHNATGANGDYMLVLRKDGNLVIVGPSIWRVPPPPALGEPRLLRSSESLPYDNILYTSETLLENQSITQGVYAFVMQPECNLALYESDYRTWESNTTGLAQSCFATLLVDGNLIVASPDKNGVIWQSYSGTNADGESMLVLRKDGNAVIVGNPVWTAPLTPALGEPRLMTVVDGPKK